MRKSFLSYLRRKVGLDVNIKDWGNGVWQITAGSPKDRGNMTAYAGAIAEFKKQNPQLHIEHVVPFNMDSQTTPGATEGYILITR